MAASRVFEQVGHTPHMALSVVDALARALRVGGEFPPLLGDVSCEVLEATAPAPTRFDPPRALYTFRNRSGYVVTDGTYTETGDSSRRWPLGPGTYRVRLCGELYQDAEFVMLWPPAGDARRIAVPQSAVPDSVALMPSPAYPLPDVTLGQSQLGPTLLRGSVFASDGTPIAGAVVETINLLLSQPNDKKVPPLGDWPFLRAVSQVSGDWALVLPGRRYIDPAPDVLPRNLPPLPTPPLRKLISVRITTPAGAVTTTVQEVLLGSEHAVRNTALRGQVLGPGGRPIAGARIETSASPVVSRSRSDGSWYLYFDLNQPAAMNVDVTATTPAGDAATDSTSAVRPGATAVVPTFHFL